MKGIPTIRELAQGQIQFADNRTERKENEISCRGLHIPEPEVGNL